jgi:hypothetical protein
MSLGAFRQSNYLAAAAPAGRTAQTFTSINSSVSSAQKKFGTNSCNGFEAGYFTVNGHTDSSFTLETWARFTNFSTSYRTLFGNRETGGSNSFGLGLYNSDIFTLQNSDQTNRDFSLGISLSANTWYHIAITVDGSSCKLYINGTQRGGTQTLSGPFITRSEAGKLRIGASSLGQSIVGFMDEIRLSKGLRYTANFTEPASAFVNDADTVLLCHCEVSPLVDDNG